MNSTFISQLKKAAAKTIFISLLAQAARITGSSPQFHRPTDPANFCGLIQKQSPAGFL
jgi:hypothetical protein